MASQPEIAPPDIVEPQSPSETPAVEPAVEEPGNEPPEIVPDRPDQDFPAGSPDETPPPPD
jgi:hypothetical protein